MNKLWDLIKELPGFAMLRADRSVYAHAAKRVRDPRLRMALSFHPLFIGGDPVNVTSMYILVSHLERAFGVHYAMGGVQALADAMGKVIEEQGGTLRLGEEVDEIITSGRQVRGVKTKGGHIISADLVVSNADPGFTYGHLLRKRQKTRWSDPRMKKARWSMGLFVLVFRYQRHRRDVERCGPSHNYQRTALSRIAEDIFQKRHLADDMSIYLHRPSVTDPSVAPDGDDTFYALSPVPNLVGNTPVDWGKEIEPYRQKLARVLEEQAIPGFEKYLSTSEIFTPETFRPDTLALMALGFR